MLAHRALVFRSFAAALAGLAALAALTAVRCGSPCHRPDAPAPLVSPDPPPAGSALVHVHVKPRPGCETAVAASRRTRLFSPLPPGTHDGRERWLDVEMPAADVDLLVRTLSGYDIGIEEAFVPPVTTLASVARATRADDDSCPIATPSFESYQGYLGAAPHGIDAPAAWRRGARGQGVWFADIEGNWNPAHEDLPGDRIIHAGGSLISD